MDIREAEPSTRGSPRLRSPGSGLRSLSLATICTLAAAIPIDYTVSFIFRADKLRTPSVYLSMAALLLSLPFLPFAGLGRRIAPILLIAGSMVAGMVSLFVLRASGFAGGPLLRLDWPLRLAAMSVLFAFAASQGVWRRRLLRSYLFGWAVFVGYGLYALQAGRAEIVHMAVERSSLVGLDVNEQSILAATGMVVLVDEALRARSPLAVFLYLGALLAGGAVLITGASRSAALALSCGLVVVFVGWLRSGPALAARRGVKPAMIALLLGAGAAALVQRSELAREAIDGYALRIEASLTGTDLGKRDELAGRTWRMAVAEPWHGLGFGGSRERLGGDPHNGYLRIFAEGGAVAALLLLMGLLLAGSSLARQVGRGRGAGPAGALVVLLIWAAAGQALVEAPFWFFLAVVSAGTGEDAA